MTPWTQTGGVPLSLLLMEVMYCKTEYVRIGCSIAKQ